MDQVRGREGGREGEGGTVETHSSVDGSRGPRMTRQKATSNILRVNHFRPAIRVRFDLDQKGPKEKSTMMLLFSK